MTNAQRFPIPPCSPFPPSSDFAKIFAIIYACRKTGVGISDLVTCYRDWSLKDIKKADYDVRQVIGIGKTAGWLVEKSGLITLILDEKSQKLGDASVKPDESPRRRTGSRGEANATA